VLGVAAVAVVIPLVMVVMVVQAGFLAVVVGVVVVV
jgi:hypothetical protein